LFADSPKQSLLTANRALSAIQYKGVTTMLIERPEIPTGHRILRRPEVEEKTGFKRAHLYNLMKAGQFPQALRLGIRAVGWDSLEVDQWIAERLKRRI
jgi:prophage regulatory protein